MIEVILWTLWAYINVTGGLFAYVAMRRLRAAKVEFGLVIKVPAYLFLVQFLIADVLFNAIVGSIYFRERPKEWTFTQRVKRHVKAGNKRADAWRRRINKVDPGHI